MAANTQIRASGLPRLSVGSSAAAIAVSLLIAVFVLFFFATAMDRREIVHTERFTSALLGDQVELVQRALSAFSSWGDVYAHINPTFDASWAFNKNNLGSALQDHFGIDLILVYDPHGNEVRTIEAGEASTMPIGGKIYGDVMKLVAEARIQAPDEKPAIGYGIYQGCPVLLAATTLKPINYAVGFHSETPTSVLVFGLRLTPYKLNVLGHKLFVENLHVAMNDEDANRLPRHVEPVLDGSQAIVFRWDADQPGRHIVAFVLPGLIIAFAMMSVWLILLLRNYRKSTQQIAQAGARLMAAHRDAEFRATHDMMTGLANRPRLTVELDRMLSQGQHLAVLFIDLDRFKPVNDGLGHAAGDRALQQVAARLVEIGGLIAARVGGDEFVLVLDVRQRGENYVENYCREMIDVISAPMTFEDMEVRVGASVGVSLAPEHSLVAADLLRYADIALYQAKEAGRGTYKIFSPAMNARILERRVIEEDLRLALRHNEFELYYQPRVNAGTLEISSVEALIRWNHPRRGLVSPMDFIPIAEDVGLIVPIGEWVLREACRTAVDFDLPVSVNISAVQFRHTKLVSYVSEVLEETGLPPDRLEIELTETALLEATDSARSTVDALKALGVRLAMDDFGTGYASIGYLRNFHFDVLKIDRMFVADLTRSKEARAIIEAMVALGQAMGMLVVAEGVETAEQLSMLSHSDNLEAQGYHTGRPCRAEEIMRLLEKMGRGPGRSGEDQSQPAWRRRYFASRGRHPAETSKS